MGFLGEDSFLRTPQFWRVALLLGCGIFLLVWAGAWVEPRPSPRASEQQAAKRSPGPLEEEERKLEERLRSALSRVAGAGRVEVVVSLAAGPEQVYARDTVKEEKVTAQEGGEGRKTSEASTRENLVFVKEVSGGREEPVVVKSLRPEVAGVLVLAEGARDPEVREELTLAVATVLAVPQHRVRVLPRGSG